MNTHVRQHTSSLLDESSRPFFSTSRGKSKMPSDDSSVWEYLDAIFLSRPSLPLRVWRPAHRAREKIGSEINAILFLLRFIPFIIFALPVRLLPIDSRISDPGGHKAGSSASSSPHYGSCLGGIFIARRLRPFFPSWPRVELCLSYPRYCC